MLIALVVMLVVALVLSVVVFRLVLRAVEGALDWLIYTFGNERAVRDVERRRGLDRPDDPTP